MTQGYDTPSTTGSPSSGMAGTTGAATREVAHEAKAAAGDVAGTAVEKAGEVQQEAVAQVRNLVHEATTQVRTQADAQTARVAEGMGSLGDQLRALVDGRPEDAAMIRDYLQEGADRLSSWSARLQSQGIEGTLDEVQRFARRRPGVFLLGALGLGVGVGRVLRGAQAASSDNDAPDTSLRSPTEVRGTLGLQGEPSVPAPATMPTPVPEFGTVPPSGGPR